MSIYLNVKYYNNTYFEIVTNSTELLKDIKRRFTFKINKYKLKSKDGKKVTTDNICILKRDRFMYVGLLEDLLMYLDEINVDYIIDDELLSKNNIDIEKYKSFINKLNLPFNPTIYQLNAVITALTEKRKLILSPTSSGKSLMIYIMIMSYIATRKDDKKVLLIVPSIGLVNQMYADFMLYASKNDNIDISKYYQKLSGEEKVKELEKEVLITTWQSIQNKDISFFHQFNMVLFDEVHGAKAKIAMDIMQKCNSDYKIGLTGTLANDDDELSEYTIKGLFGSISIATTYQELIDMEFITPMEIRILTCQYNKIEKLTYQEECNYIKSSKDRLYMIIKMLGSFEGNTLILFKSKDYGSKLYNSFKKSYPYRKLYYIDGSVSGKEREEIRQKIEREESDDVILTFGDIKIIINKNINVPLSNGTFKKAGQITLDDDVCDKWIIENKK